MISIEGRRIYFNDARGAEEFLADSRNLHAALGYLNVAKESGQTFLSTPNGNRYILKYSPEKDEYVASYYK